MGADGKNVARKGFAVRLDPGPGGIGRGHAWILHELDTLRAAAVWTGDAFTDWRGINFDGSHGTHPRVMGDLLATTPTQPGWADPTTGSFADPRPVGRDGKPYGPLPGSHARFRAVHHAGDRIVLDYAVGTTRILEATRLEAADAAHPAGPVVTRIWSVAPHDCEHAVCVAGVGSEKMATAAAIIGRPSPHARLEVREGFHVLVLPPSRAAATIGVAIANGTAEALAARIARMPAPESLDAGIGRPARDPWNTRLETRAVVGAADVPFATDVLTAPFVNPWNAQLRLSGLDFLSADAAVVCTWDGDVWTVSGLATQSAVSQPLAWLTNAFDRSPAELVRVPPSVWPPLSGQLLELSYGEGRMHLVLTQPVTAERPGYPPRLQGGLVQLSMPDFPTGIMRGRFRPQDHAFYTCGLFAWAGNKTAPGGLFRVRRTSAPLRMPTALATTADGFTVTFSAPLDRTKAVNPAAWTYRQWSLNRSANYGSEHVGERSLKIAGVDLSSDGLTATVRIEDFGTTQCYELAWNLIAEDGASVTGRIHGTVHAAR